MRFTDEELSLKSRNVKIRYDFHMFLKFQCKKKFAFQVILSMPLQDYREKWLCKIYDFWMRLFWMLVRLKVGP